MLASVSIMENAEAEPGGTHIEGGARGNAHRGRSQEEPGREEGGSPKVLLSFLPQSDLDQDSARSQSVSGPQRSPVSSLRLQLLLLTSQTNKQAKVQVRGEPGVRVHHFYLKLRENECKNRNDQKQVYELHAD